MKHKTPTGRRKKSLLDSIYGKEFVNELRVQIEAEKQNHNYLFTFEWTDTNKSANDYIREWCKEHNIRYRYNGFFQLEADVFRMNDYVQFEFFKIKDNLYGVEIKGE
jgi:hypothetical protein